MLLKTDESWEDFMTDIADLRGSRSVLAFVVLQAVLTLELFVALHVQECGQHKERFKSLFSTHLIAMEDWLSVRDLMLFESMALVEAFEAVLALEFWLMRYVLERRLTRLGFLCFRFAVDLLVVSLFMILQVLSCCECVIAEAAIEQRLRWLHELRVLQVFFFDLHAEQHLSLVCGHKIHFFLEKMTRKTNNFAKNRFNRFEISFKLTSLDPGVLRDKIIN